VAVLAQLGLDGLVVLARIGAVERLEVEHVHEQPAALDVGQELVAEAGAAARALDETWDVGHDQLPLVALERAKHRLERGEGVVRHLWLSARHPGEERRLAGVRQPDETGVRHQPQLKLEGALLAGEAALGEARALTGGRGELLVAAPAATASGHQRPLPGSDQVPAVAGLWVLHHRARGHSDLEQLRRGAVLVRALPVAAARGVEVRPVPEAREVAQRRVGDDHHVATTAAVAPVRAALGDVRLAPEGDHAVPAIAASHVDARAVVEHGLGLRHRARADQPRDQLAVVWEEPGAREPLQQLDPAGVRLEGAAQDRGRVLLAATRGQGHAVPEGQLEVVRL
jgi:hypothetical protein